MKMLQLVQAPEAFHSKRARNACWVPGEVGNFLELTENACWAPGDVRPIIAEALNTVVCILCMRSFRIHTEIKVPSRHFELESPTECATLGYPFCVTSSWHIRWESQTQG